MDVKTNLVPCAHCSETGTCRTGDNGSTCLKCVKLNEVKGALHYGLSCGCCGGLGKAEIMSDRDNKRLKPVISVLTVVFMAILLYASFVTQSQHFMLILYLFAALIAGILGNSIFSKIKLKMKDIA